MSESVIAPLEFQHKQWFFETWDPSDICTCLFILACFFLCFCTSPLTFALPIFLIVSSIFSVFSCPGFLLQVFYTSWHVFSVFLQQLMQLMNYAQPTLSATKKRHKKTQNTYLHQCLLRFWLRLIFKSLPNAAGHILVFEQLQKCKSRLMAFPHKPSWERGTLKLARWRATWLNGGVSRVPSLAPPHTSHSVSSWKSSDKIEIPWIGVLVQWKKL